MAISFEDMAAEIAALRALVRGLLALSFKGEDMATSTDAILRQNLQYVRGSDAPEVTQHDEILRKATGIAYQILQEGREAAKR